jgi:ribosomal protein S27E
MKVNWKVHPSNLGHLYSAGCFRCHDNQHVSADGKILSKDCNLCHNVLEQREGGRMMVETPDSVFTHPVDLGDMEEMNCIDCHSGASM